MRPKENLRVPMPKSPSPGNKLRLPGTPEQYYTVSGKRQLSPSNHSYNPEINNAISQFLKDQKTSSLEDRPVEQSNTRILKLENQQKRLKKIIEELRIENSQLMGANEALKLEIFAKESQKINYENMEEQLFNHQKLVQGLEIELKEKTHFIQTQKIAKEYNADKIDGMRFEIQRIHQLYDYEKSIVKQLNIKIKKLQEEHLKSKRRVKQLERNALEKMQRDGNQTSKYSEKQTETLKEKIRVLTGINDRQKKQIIDLMSALDSKAQLPSSTMTTTQLKPSQSNTILFQHQYSSIMQRCFTETDQDLKVKLAELEDTIDHLKNQNNRLNNIIDSTKNKNKLLRQVEDLRVEREVLETELMEQHTRIANMNQQIYQQNHQIYTLKQESEHQQSMKIQMEEINNRLVDQIKETYDEKMKYLKQSTHLQEKVNELEKTQQLYEVMCQQFSKAEQSIQQKQDEIKELERKNQQLLLYVQDLRASEQKLNYELIQRNYELEQAKSQKTKYSLPISSSNENQRKIEKLLRERNVVLINNLNKFKQFVLDQLQVMSLQLVIALNTSKTEESKDVIGKLRRRVDAILSI